MAYLIIIYKKGVKMKEIGLSLKTKREENGVTVEEAAEDLKLRPSQIISIEDGKIEDFKDVFYLKYFIRDYAKYLGMDGNKLVDQFNEFLFDYTSKIPIKEIEEAKKEKENMVRNVVSPYTLKRKEKFKIPAYVIYIIIGIILLVVGYVIIGNLQNDSFEEDEITYVERG